MLRESCFLVAGEMALVLRFCLQLLAVALLSLCDRAGIYVRQINRNWLIEQILSRHSSPRISVVIRASCDVR